MNFIKSYFNDLVTTLLTSGIMAMLGIMLLAALVLFGGVVYVYRKWRQEKRLTHLRRAAKKQRVHYDKRYRHGGYEKRFNEMVENIRIANARQVN